MCFDHTLIEKGEGPCRKVLKCAGIGVKNRRNATMKRERPGHLRAIDRMKRVFGLWKGGVEDSDEGKKRTLRYI